MALRHFRADLGAMSLSVFAVMLGVALVVGVLTMNGTVLRGFLDTVDGILGRASFSITAGEGLTFPEDVLERVAEVQGVELAVPLVRAVTFIDDGSGELLTLHGIDLTHDADVRLYHSANDAKSTIPDVLQFLNNPDSIVIGRELADRRGLHRGDSLDLVTPAGVRRFVVRGLLDPEGLAGTLKGRLVVMDLYAAERAFTADGQITQIDVVVRPNASVDATKAAVAAVVGDGLVVEEPALRKDVIRRTVGGFHAMLTAFGLLAVGVGALICYSRLGAIAAVRTWEAGLMRAVGLRRGAVFGEMLKESALLGLVGTILGVPLGLVIAHFAVPSLASATAINFRLPASEGRITVDPSVVAVGVLTGLAAALLATVIPALQLAKTAPATALGWHGRGALASESPLRWRMAATLGAAAAALIAIQRAFAVPTLGLLTTGLIVVATALLVTPLARVGTMLLGAIWKKAFGPAGRLAIAHVGRQAPRSALTVATLGLGLGTVLLFGILGWSFERTLVARLGESERADMVISSAYVSGGYRSAPLADGLLAELRAVPGIALVAGEQSTDVAYGGASIVLKSCDAACFTDDRLYEWPLEAGAMPDARDRVARGDAVLVTTSFARQFGLRTGETMTLAAPNGPVTLPIAGVSSGAPETAVFVTRDRYVRGWNDTSIWTANVALDANAEYATVERRVQEKLGVKYRLLIRSSAELIEYFADQVRQAFSLQYLLEVVTLLLVASAIGDTLAASVLERRREIGMMRAVGLRRTHLVRIIVLEGVAIGVLGLVMATLTGLALGTFWVTTQFPALVGWDLDLHIPYEFAAAAMMLTLVLCVAASLLPGLRAARISVAAALRDE
jgi:putative ABC transport system permease protein